MLKHLLLALFLAISFACSKTAWNPPPAPPAVSGERPASVMLWKTLTKINPGRKEVPAEVHDLLGKELDLAGYLIINDATSDDEMSEFLLTPISGGCIHVPPPPPNYIVHVTLPAGEKTKVRYGAVLVHGTLSLAKESKKFFALEMRAKTVEDFDANPYVTY